MKNVNRVTLLGHLTADPLVKETSSGRPMITCTIATNSAWKNPAGEWQEIADYHRIVAWDQTAAQIAAACHKGEGIWVEGRLRARSWVAENGEKKYMTEVIVRHVVLASGLPRVEGSGMDSDALVALSTEETADVAEPVAA